MADAAERHMTVAEFLNWDDGTDTRYELFRGRVLAMAPASGQHAVIVANVGATLHANLKRPCYVGSNAGVVRPDRDDTYFQADVVVSCTPIEPGASAMPAPVAIIEVLSPTTEDHDRGRKLFDYRRIPTVQEIALVASEQRHVEVWRRREAKWEVEDLIGEAALELETVAGAIPLATIYADSGI